MSGTEPSRTDRRAALLEERRPSGSEPSRPTSRPRSVGATGSARGVFGLIVVGRPRRSAATSPSATSSASAGRPRPADAIASRARMAGFAPGEIQVKAGQTVDARLWTNDAAPHLQGGVHTMISDELGIYEELPAAGPSGESRRVVAFTAPTTPGDVRHLLRHVLRRQGQPDDARQDRRRGVTMGRASLSTTPHPRGPPGRRRSPRPASPLILGFPRPAVVLAVALGGRPRSSPATSSSSRSTPRRSAA